jgi:putative flippase GtrA
MHRRPGALFAQLLKFNALILVAVVFNQATYLAAVRVAPYLVAGAVGIGATTLAKYFIADRWIFRTRRQNLRAAVPAAN